MKKIEKDDVLDIFKNIKNNLPDNYPSMDDGALSLWYNKIKSNNLATIESNLNSASNSRTQSLQNFLNIAFQLATFDARVNYELAYFVHSIRMLGHAEREKILQLANMEVDIYKKRMENKMLGMEYGLSVLDYQMKKQILMKVNPTYDDDDEEEERPRDEWTDDIEEIERELRHSDDY